MKLLEVVLWSFVAGLVLGVLDAITFTPAWWWIGGRY